MLPFPPLDFADRTLPTRSQNPLYSPRSTSIHSQSPEFGYLSLFPCSWDIAPLLVPVALSLAPQFPS